ncbi:MAG: RdgB/HAM1 family non-canonical purine NTP pyrophosphatase [Proteobacteria bacterium]|nr:RdgB/HAM1 family non-canonical purine NTP pyrophosphatase [Pseudomonadota bacterium]
MTDSLAGETLVIATHNPGKLREIVALIEPFGVDVVAAAELGLPEPEETGASFAENAALKAHAAAAGSGHPALADDSGLAVAALGGAPGIHSARWAGPNKDFAAAMARVERELAAARASGVEDRRAAFVCALCLAYPDGREQIFEGRIEGRLTWPPRGEKGFGYDPMFLAEGHEITFGEMEPAEKHQISHRARAFAKLVRDVFGGAR